MIGQTRSRQRPGLGVGKTDGAQKRRPGPCAGTGCARPHGGWAWCTHQHLRKAVPLGDCLFSKPDAQTRMSRDALRFTKLCSDELEDRQR